MEDTLSVFLACNRRLHTGQDINTLQTEIEIVLSSPFIWDVCFKVIIEAKRALDSESTCRCFLAAKMMHMVIRRSWSQLPTEQQDLIKQELFANIFSTDGAKLNSPDTAMLCRSGAAALISSKGASIDEDTRIFISAIVRRPADKLLGIRILSEVAAELSDESSVVSNGSSVICRYRSLVLGLYADTSFRLLHFYNSSRLQPYVPVRDASLREEFSNLLFMLNQSLECINAWLPVLISSDRPQMSADIDGSDMETSHLEGADGLEELLSISHFLEADRNSDVLLVVQSLNGSKLSISEMFGGVSISQNLCEHLLPSLIDSYRIYLETHNSDCALYQLCTSTITASANVLVSLFRRTSGRMIMNEMGNDHLQALQTCNAALSAVAAVSTCWELIFGITIEDFLKITCKWALHSTMPPSAEKAVSETSFLVDVRKRLLVDQNYGPLLWRDKYFSAEAPDCNFGVPSPFLIALTEMTVHICEKQSSLLFGEGELYTHSRSLRSRSAVEPGLLSTGLDTSHQGKMMWCALVYFLLALPDDKQAIALSSEFLSYLQDTSPADILFKENLVISETMELNTNEIMRCFPLVLSSFLKHHCAFCSLIDSKFLVFADLRKRGFELNDKDILHIDSDISEFYRNSNSVRIEASVMVRCICLQLRHGKEVLLESCSGAVAELQQIISALHFKKNGDFTTAACGKSAVDSTIDRLLRHAEAKIYLLFCLGESTASAIEGISSLSSEASPPSSSFSPSTPRGKQGTTKGLTAQSVSWLRSWLHMSLSIVSCFQELKTLTTSINPHCAEFRMIFYLSYCLNNSFSMMCTMIPFFVNSLSPYLDMTERSTIVSSVGSVFKTLMIDVNINQLPFSRHADLSIDDFQFHTSMLIAVADTSLATIDGTIMALCGLEDCMEEESLEGLCCPHQNTNHGFCNKENIAALLNTWISMDVIMAAIEFISGEHTSSKGTDFKVQYVPRILKIIRYYYSILGRLLSVLSDLGVSEKDTSIKETCVSFLKHQVEVLFSNLDRQMFDSLKCIWERFLHLDTEVYNPSGFCSPQLLEVLKSLQYPFPLPFLSRLSDICFDKSIEDYLYDSSELCEVALTCVRCISAAISGLQLGINRNYLLRYAWTTLVCEFSGYEKMLRYIEELNNAFHLSLNSIKLGKFVLTLKLNEYDALHLFTSERFPKFKLHPREQNTSFKKQLFYLDKMEKIWVLIGFVVSDDICNLISELEDSKYYRPIASALLSLGCGRGDIAASVLDLAKSMSHIASPLENSLADACSCLINASGGRMAVHRLQTMPISASIIRMYGSFFSGSCQAIEIISSAAVAQSSDHAINIVRYQHNSTNICKAVALIMYIHALSVSTMAQSIKIQAFSDSDFDNTVLHLQDALLASLRLFRHLFLTTPAELLVLESSFLPSALKLSEYGNTLSSYPDAFGGFFEPKTSLVRSFLLIVKSAVDLEIELTSERYEISGRHFTRTFQLLLASYKIFVEVLLDPLKQPKFLYDPVFQLWLTHTDSMTASLLRWLLFLRENNKSNQKFGLEILVTILKGLSDFSNRAYPGGASVLVDRIQVICLSLATHFPAGFLWTFPCRDVSVVHSCGNPGVGCVIGMKAPEVCMLIRNTLLKFISDTFLASGEISEKKGGFQRGSKNAKTATNALAKVIEALGNVLSCGKNSAKGPMLCWELPDGCR